MVPVKSCAQRLQEQLGCIEQKMMELLDASKIMRFRNDPSSGIVFLGSEYYWGETDDHQKRLQLDLMQLYRPWIEQVRLLLSQAPKEIISKIDETDRFLMSWLQKERSLDIPATTRQAKTIFSQRIQTFAELLHMLEASKQRRIIVVPDTNALAICPEFSRYAEISGQTGFTVVIMPTVLSELDQLKITARDEEFRNRVKSVITRIKGLRNQGSLIDGVTVNREMTVRMEAREPDFRSTLSWLEPGNNDDRLIASVLELQRREPCALLILCTGDINLQNKAEMANIPFAEPPAGD